ncbi:MAG TPA: hypothetical protein VGL91_22240 [Acidobacteriota bacterium]
MAESCAFDGESFWLDGQPGGVVVIGFYWVAALPRYAFELSGVSISEKQVPYAPVAELRFHSSSDQT